MSKGVALSHEAVELQIYIDNNNRMERIPPRTGALWPALYPIKNAIFALLAKHKVKDTYHASRAPAAFARLIDQAAKKYAVEHGGGLSDWNRIFSKKDRDELAQYYADTFEIEYRLGNLNHLLPKTKQVEPKGLKKR